MTRKKRVCECTTWEPRPHEPCGDSECGECVDCDECGNKGFYFITSDETRDPFDTADCYSTDLDGDLPMFEAPESAVDDCWANDGPLEPNEGITVYGFRDHGGFCTMIAERYYSAAEVAAIVGEGEQC